MNQRENYIRTQWKPYPTFESGDSQFFGKISQINPISFEISRLSLPPRSFDSSLLLRGTKLAAKDILRRGDVVAVSKDSHIILLAPQLIAGKEIANLKFVTEWSCYLQFLRQFFISRDFLEVQTPQLVACPGTEPSLDVFSTEMIFGQKRKKYFLPTSPELHLKKILAQGAEKIFEITTSFRNGELTERHQPEFKILEFYRAYENLSSIKTDIAQLISFLCEQFQVSHPAKVTHYSVAELFKKYCDFEFTPQTTALELKALAEKLQVDVRSATSVDDYFFLIFMEKIESQWPKDQLVFVEKYPPYQAALARVDQDGWAERFEFYWKGLELGNAFYELNDPGLQRLRSQEDLQKKREMGKPTIDLDEEFFQALESGMPPSAGIAVGLERLFMCLFNSKRIEETMIFSKY